MKKIDDQTLEDLHLQTGEPLLLEYGDWGIWLEVIDIKDNYESEKFEVITAYGKGIIENLY